MAKKISSFQELTDLSLSVEDYLPIIDESEIQANMNKRVTIATLDSRYILSNITEDTSSVTISGDIVPSKNNTYSIGLENRQYKNLFVKDVSVSNNLYVSETIDVSTLNVTHTISAEDISVSNNIVAGTLSVGETSISSTGLSTQKAAYFNNSVDVTGTLSVGETTISSTGLSTQNGANFNGSVVAGTLSVGETTISSTGLSTQNGAYFNGSVDVAGTLSVDNGETTISSTGLSTQKGANFNGGISASDVSVSNNLEVDGSVSVTNTLEATDVSVGRDLFINLGTLPTSYDSNYPNRVWLSDGVLRIGEGLIFQSSG